MTEVVETNKENEKQHEAITAAVNLILEGKFQNQTFKTVNDAVTGLNKLKNVDMNDNPDECINTLDTAIRTIMHGIYNDRQFIEINNIIIRLNMLKETISK